MTRSLCTHCHYPTKSCVCQFVQRVDNHVSVWVLQHPHEVSQAKSTTPLLQLTLSKFSVYVGEQPEDFIQIQALPSEHCAVLYPSADAKAVETLDSEDMSTIKHLIVLDGTWNKVHRLWQSNPWLHTLNAVTFAHVPNSRYLIRKANREQSLSTLEACAYCLGHLEQLNTAPLLSLLDGFVEVQTQHMPSDVRSRYLK